MKAVLYARCSTDVQETSIDNQYLELEKHAEEHEIEILDRFHDEAVSGAQLWQRKGLFELLDYIKTISVDVLLVSALDRLSRDDLDLGWIASEVERVTKDRTRIRSLNAKEDLYDEENFTERWAKVLFARLERRAIRARFQGGKLIKKAKGGFIGGQAPLGYVVRSKNYAIDESKVHTIRRIFELAGEDSTLQQIANRLNEEGHTTQKGAEFKPTSVKRALERRDLYAGNLPCAPKII